MKTVRLILDEFLVEEVDRVTLELGITVAAVTQRALRSELKRIEIAGLEKAHRKGYEETPVDLSKVGPWEDEQVWP